MKHGTILAFLAAFLLTLALVFGLSCGGGDDDDEPTLGDDDGDDDDIAPPGGDDDDDATDDDATDDDATDDDATDDDATDDDATDDDATDDDDVTDWSDARSYSGTWTGTMEISTYSGFGGGPANIVLELNVSESGGFTGTFSASDCPGSDGCPDQEPLVGAIDIDAAAVEFGFVFTGPSTGFEYHYDMTGAIAPESMSGTFSSIDQSSTPRTYGTWLVTQ